MQWFKTALITYENLEMEMLPEIYGKFRGANYYLSSMYAS